MDDDPVDGHGPQSVDVPRERPTDVESDGGYDDADSAAHPDEAILEAPNGFVAAFVVAAVGLPLLYLTQPLHFDEGLFLAVGKRIAIGDTLYVDIADHKPPAIFLVAATAYEVAGAPILVARVLTYAVTAVSGLLVVALGRSVCDRRVAYGAGVLFVVMTYLPHFDGGFFLTEPYVALTLLVAAILRGRATRRANAVAGASLGIGVLFNQTVLLFGGTIVLFHLVRCRFPDDRTGAALRRSIQEILAIGAGFLAVMALTSAALAYLGVLREAVYYTVLLPFTNYSTPFDATGHLFALATLLPVWLLAGDAVLRTARSLVGGDRVDDGVLFVVLWAVVMSVPGAVGFAGDHKFLFAFPAVALLAAMGLATRYGQLGPLRDTLGGIRRDRSDARTLVPVVVVAVVLSTTVLAGGVSAISASNLMRDDLGGERADLAAAVEGLDGPVYAYNVQASLYVHTDVEPATTFVGTMYADEIAHDKIDDLERRGVRYVLVKDAFVSDGRIVPHGYWADSKSIMTAYLNANFAPTRSTGEWVLYERVTEAERTVDSERGVDSPAGRSHGEQPGV